MPTSASVAPFLSMKAGGSAAFVAELTSKKEVADFAERCRSEGKQMCIVGGGTNTLFDDGEHSDAAVGLMRIRGWSSVEADGTALVTIGAGEDWDESVKKLVEAGLQGAEALSGIPGTVGGAPIQNIGAYGSEVKDILESVEAFNTEANSWKIFTRDECEFSYRDSIFKKSPGRYIIAYVTLRLKKSPTAPVPNYKDTLAHFAGNVSPTLSEVREAILDIRAKKLPDPKVVPNCGSFFKNPFVSLAKADELKRSFPDIPVYPDGSQAKISAGWLVEQSGFKGSKHGKAGTYANNALVVTAEPGAATGDILAFAAEIVSAVEAKFGVTLEREPVLLPPR